MSLTEAETARLQKMSVFEKRLHAMGYQCIAGVDEAGRGPLAGPVVAAACILPEEFLLPKLNDSKKLTAQIREELYGLLTTNSQAVYGVGIVHSADIDRLNILRATLLAMQRAIGALAREPDYLLIDGNTTPKTSIPSTAIVEGDANSLSIAAASVIAKVTRDRMMDQLDEKYPLYGFKHHKGYGTPEHLQAIHEHGPCPIHRLSFDPVKEFFQLRLF